MKDNNLSIKGFLVWGVCAFFFLYEFLLRTVIGTFQHAIVRDLNITAVQFSVLSTTIFATIYGVMQIPVGLIISRFGLKKSTLLGASCCTIACLGFSSVSSFSLALGFRLLMGFGASFGFICLLMAVHDWMPRKNIAVFIGVSQFIGTLGPMVAAGPLHSLAVGDQVSWRFIFLALSAIGAINAILIMLFVENNKESSGEYTILQRPNKTLPALKKLIKQAQPWYIAFISMGVYFAVEYLSENEGRAFLLLKGISLSSASYMITLSWFGFAVGSPLMGFLSDWLQRRRIIIQISAAVGLLAMLAIIFLPDKRIVGASFLIMGVTASSLNISFAMIAEYFKKQYVAMGFGLNNAVVFIAAAINAPLIGAILDRSKDPLTLNTYFLAFSVLIVTAVLTAFVALFLLKETYCKSRVDFTILDPKQKQPRLNS